MRTQEEIVEQVRRAAKRDFFGAGVNDLVIYLTFANAREFVADGVTEDTWEDAGYPKELREDHVKDEVRAYLGFAWGKANGCRGLSASRSMEHLRAWLWLLGDEAYSGFEEIPYEHYGKHRLAYASELVGVDWRALDDGTWRNSEDDTGVPAPPAEWRATA